MISTQLLMFWFIVVIIIFIMSPHGKKSRRSADKKASEQFIILGPLDYAESSLISEREYVVVINYVQHYNFPSQGHQNTYNGLRV